jgi:hypothetical protein
MMANKDIERALMEALGGGGPKTSMRPRMRPKGMGESGKTMSDADKLKMMMMMGESGKTMSDSDRGRSRGIGEAGKTLSDKDIEYLEQMMQRQQMEQGAAERKAFPPPSMMNRGGEVQGYKPGGAVRKKKKSKMGCVMSGRGGKYKGMK